MRTLNFINVPLILSSIFFLVLAWFVSTRTPRRNLGIRFVAFSVVYSIYSLSIGCLALFLDKRIALCAAHAASVSGVLSIPLMYDFLLTAAEIDARRLRISRCAAYSIAGVFIAVFAFQISQVGLADHWWGYYASRSQFLPAFMVFITVLISHAEWILWRRSCASRSTNEKNQLRMLFWSTLLTIPSASSNIGFCLYDIGRYPFSSLGGLCYAVILGYAVLRYRLLDIDIALRKGLLYTLLTAALTSVFVGTVLYIQGIITRHTDWSVILPSIISTMVVALVLQPFRGRIQSVIDRRFFRTSYDLHKAVAQFTEFIISETDFHQVLTNMVHLIHATFHVAKVGVFLVNDPYRHFDYAYGVGFDSAEPVPPLPEDSATIRWLATNFEPLFRADLGWHPLLEDESLQEAVLSELNVIGAEVVLPIVYQKRLRGFVSLGSKSSEEAYTNEDLTLLNTVASEAAVAIENARLVEALREEDRRKAQFITDMAHELKTPVTSIKLFSQILADGVEDDEKRGQFLKILMSESDRYVGLVNDFLYFARLDGQPRPLKKQHIDLNEVINETLAIFQVQAEEKNLRLYAVPSDGGNGHGGLNTVPGDRDRLKQVFINLVNNAIKYTGNGGEVTIQTSVNGQYISTRVIDNGIGIPADDLPKVFDKYYRTRHARTMVGAGGAGIGLTIAKDIIENHGGTLTVQSEPGVGSAFIVNLPTG